MDLRNLRNFIQTERIVVLDTKNKVFHSVQWFSATPWALSLKTLGRLTHSWGGLFCHVFLRR